MLVLAAIGCNAGLGGYSRGELREQRGFARYYERVGALRICSAADPTKSSAKHLAQLQAKGP